VRDWKILLKCAARVLFAVIYVCSVVFWFLRLAGIPVHYDIGKNMKWLRLPGMRTPCMIGGLHFTGIRLFLTASRSEENQRNFGDIRPLFHSNVSGRKEKDVHAETTVSLADVVITIGVPVRCCRGGR
jgi:hypothetical protein